MKEINEKQSSHEANEMFLVNSNSGAAYEFNIVPFNGNVAELKQRIGDVDAGIFLFIQKTEGYKILHKGESCNIVQSIGAVDENAISSATHFCYVYEPAEHIRKEIVNDLCD